ncbi:hypothetical protein SERLA73DRAFT_63966 [Serpula lacrymans var. lacrymans S7.3]|uniref:Uncharacterized protein n=2 Tax=Serpula lacrymans var. lacrymans TaxID=341189 RepID=F8QE39_SERL3|nr:hypothetical protein SERLA73DRAFT_63966 [Serpula lacrymans var. lacrymans S7.3]
MKEDFTKMMWGIFEGSRIVLALCRHGFLLVIVDMVQSSELTKYPLAVIEKMLDVFSSNLGGGFDIGCKFKTMLNKSPLGAGARALNYALNHTCLVGAFHGHAHHCLCQLSHIATYTNDLGLEDLKGYEHTFSKSNELSGSLCYSSTLHRKQAISTYFEHKDT